MAVDREGARRRADRRRGDWQDGVLFGLLAEELLTPPAQAPPTRAAHQQE